MKSEVIGRNITLLPVKFIWILERKLDRVIKLLVQYGISKQSIRVTNKVLIVANLPQT